MFIVTMIIECFLVKWKMSIEMISFISLFWKILTQLHDYVFFFLLMRFKRFFFSCRRPSLGQAQLMFCSQTHFPSGAAIKRVLTFLSVSSLSCLLIFSGKTVEQLLHLRLLFIFVLSGGPVGGDILAGTTSTRGQGEQSSQPGFSVWRTWSSFFKR